jgi:replication fork clamp-binding protein CrfC
MTQEHPIAPPPELIEQWVKRYEDGAGLQPLFYSIFQAGADQELEACCEWVDWKWSGIKSRELRASRRPKPPSLKEQALAALKRYEEEEWCEEMTFDSSIIRRALEQIDD